MRHVEDKIQQEVIKYCRASKVLGLAFHVENEGNKSPQQAARAKRMGTLAGVPDICIPLPSGRVAWIELKTKSGRVSKKQEAMIEKLEAFGHDVYLCHGLEVAFTVLRLLENL